MLVAVGSRNPGKLSAVERAFERCSVVASVEPFPVPSGVAAQPLSAEETLLGARNRASAALEAAGADLGVGVEGGLFPVADTWFEAGWIVVVSADGSMCAAPSVGFEVPSRLLPHLLSGRDLNEAVEAELGIPEIGEGAGIMGLLSQGAVSRARAYEDAVVMALSRLRSPSLWV